MRPSAKTSVMKRFKRIEGQVRGLARMVEQDRYCIDVVTQLSAVRGAVGGAWPTTSPIASSTRSRPATRASSGARSAN
jgi:hypothetical protein